MLSSLTKLLATTITLSVVAILAACGGGGEKKPGAAPPVPINPEKTVNVGLTPDSCIGNHNADSDISFLMGDKQARYLLWNCGNHETHNKQLIRIFFPFNYTLQCYQQASVHVDFGRCTNPLTAPKNPLFNVTVADLDVRVGRNSGGLPGFSFRANIQNSGNVPAFNLDFEFQIDRNTGGNSGRIDLMEPGESKLTPQFETYSQAFAGRQFILELFVRDGFGNIVAGRTTTVVVNPI